VSHDLKYNESVGNPCKSASCSHLCLIIPNNGFRCSCPEGYSLSQGSTSNCDAGELAVCEIFWGNFREYFANFLRKWGNFCEYCELFAKFVGKFSRIFCELLASKNFRRGWQSLPIFIITNLVRFCRKYFESYRKYLANLNELSRFLIVK
jgi:hypothetical protein